MLYSLFREKFVEEVKHCHCFQDFVSDKDLSDIDEYRKNGVFLQELKISSWIPVQIYCAFP